MVTFSGRKISWLIYTVLFGMVPIFMRIIAYMLVNDSKIPMFSASDFISLGIVLHVSLMAETRYNDSQESDWKKSIVGISVLAVLFYAVLYIFSMLSDIYDNINMSFVFWAPVVMAVCSFAMSWAVYDRLTYMPALPKEVVA
ncbi:MULTISPECIES: hypothetical protein [Pseudomonas syringae group]|uniref:Uncharacterized protein n=2 Tax=Pseudomonas syringae group TaxID=136849 RepID=A0AAE6QJJ1_9PSED|nr:MULTISPECIES: hypothetical protein [Pseudomonas syringae group]MCF5747427.1 hypothetical protein [Pseudomonas tremae]QGT82968.1 hypothetical protein GMO17_18220 [Pseudomonas coronafaciens pv. coronafaciens]RMS40126.1 hypothetical protein ALP71_02045 [Pseudomonas coronafaciens pv. garcae]UQB35292.1 hypothetical protein I9H09_17180 [Pseudomonas tremae]